MVRKTFSPAIKARVALEAVKGLKTQSQITAEYGVQGTQICNWKKQLKEALPEIFSTKRNRRANDKDALIEELYKQIGQLTVERDWLKKKFNSLD